MWLKRTIFRIVPARLHRLLRDAYFGLLLLPNAAYDFRRYLVFSGMNRSRAYRGEQSARIVMAYHQLEKGLSLASPRRGFGKAVVERLLDAMKLFIADHGFVPPATIAMGVLTKYVEFQSGLGEDMATLRGRMAQLVSGDCGTQASCLEGGTLEVTRLELANKVAFGFKEFFNSRYSIRHFSGGSVRDADLAEAVAISQKTPSVCNRQSWRVHAYSQKDVTARLLEIQAGNGGFGDQISTVLIVTCDLTYFIDVAERYQAWIDGGMFSMSLCLAFHSLGYGTCCLNWSKDHRDDISLRRIAGISETEQIIMMIGVGTLPETFRVAYSTRGPVENILRIH